MRALALVALAAATATCGGAGRGSGTPDPRTAIPPGDSLPLAGDPRVLERHEVRIVPRPSRTAQEILHEAIEIAQATADESVPETFEDLLENPDTDAATEAWLRIEQASILATLAVAPSPEPCPVSIETQRIAREQRRVPPGELHLRILNNHGERLTVRVFDPSGRMRADAVREVTLALRDRRADRARTIEPRLIAMLYLIGQHWDSELEVVSGYRVRGVNASGGSRHGQGRACDFRVEGVRTRDIVAWADATFARVGVGYYPTSDFVHVDVRERSFYWTDRSGPDERPRVRARTADTTADESTDVTLVSVHVTEEQLYSVPNSSPSEDE